MSIDYIMASLPALRFGEPAPITRERFEALAGEAAVPPPAWTDLETQLRNALAEARAALRGNASAAEKYRRDARGCSLYWKNRVLDAFKEPDVAKRDEALDRVWWDAAEELSSPQDPLGRGALAAYAVRLGIALRRDRISRETGKEVFDHSFS